MTGGRQLRSKVYCRTEGLAGEAAIVSEQVTATHVDKACQPVAVGTESKDGKGDWLATVGLLTFASFGGDRELVGIPNFNVRRCYEDE